MAVIALDVDGVLADFMAGVRDLHREIVGSEFPDERHVDWDCFDLFEAEHRKAVFERIQLEGWCASLGVLPGAVEGVIMLREAGHQIVFATSPWSRSRHWQWERQQWLCERFGAMPDDVVQIGAKQLLAVDLIVDDRHENLKNWAIRHHDGCDPKALLWGQSYNLSVDVPHVTEWFDSKTLQSWVWSGAPIVRCEDWSHVLAAANWV